MWWFHKGNRRARGADDRGVTTVEYGIIIAGVAIIAIPAIFALRSATSTSYQSSISGTPGVGGIAGDGTNNLPNPTISNSVAFGNPSAPLTLLAVGGDGQVTLTWSAPSSNGGSPITGYTVSGTPSGTCTPSPATSTTCTVTGLTNGLTYTFSVTATNQGGFTGAATSASATPTSASAPSAPTSVSGSPGNSQVLVSWTAPASTGGSALTIYTVTSSGGQTCTATHPTTSCSVLGLTNGIAYTFTVIATNTAGFTSAPSIASASVTPLAAPSAPTFGSVTPGNQQVVLNWTAGADNGSTRSGYTLTVKSGATTVQTLTPGAGATSTTVNSLTNGTAYTFELVANSNAGSSAAATTTATPLAAPSAPTFGSVTPGNQQVVLNWTAGADNGSTRSGYTLTVKSGATTVQTLTPGAGATSTTVNSLTNGTAYTFELVANSNAGSSAAATTTATPLAAPSAPTFGSVTPGNQQVVLNWTAGADNGSTRSGYTLTVKSGATTVQTLTPGAGATSTTVNSLTNGTAYTFELVANSNAGSSAAATTTATPLAAPSAPTFGSVTPGNQQVVLNWTAGADNGSTRSGYTLTVKSGATTVQTLTPGAGATSTTVNSLTNGTAYTFELVANSNAGSSAAATTTATPRPQCAALATPSVNAKKGTAYSGNVFTINSLSGYTVTGTPSFSGDLGNSRSLGTNGALAWEPPTGNRSLTVTFDFYGPTCSVRAGATFTVNANQN